jgi:hypothetical protein
VVVVAGKGGVGGWMDGGGRGGAGGRRGPLCACVCVFACLWHRDVGSGQWARSDGGARLCASMCAWVCPPRLGLHVPLRPWCCHVLAPLVCHGARCCPTSCSLWHSMWPAWRPATKPLAHPASLPRLVSLSPPHPQTTLSARSAEVAGLVAEKQELCIERATLEAQKAALVASGQTLSAEVADLRSKNGT